MQDIEFSYSTIWQYAIEMEHTQKDFYGKFEFYKLNDFEIRVQN